MSDFSICPADYARPAHVQAIAELMRAYSGDVMGGGKPLPLEHCLNIAPSLQSFTHATTLLAFDPQEEPIALATSFMSFSTFTLKPVLNLHDFFVAERWRGKGVAVALLDELESLARQMACCKLTLEVLGNNEPAKRCYRRFGFEPYELKEEAGCAEFWQKKLE